MLLDKTWYTVSEAVDKFGTPREMILQWVDEGVVRCEMEGKKVVLVNADDLQMKVGEVF